jgi:hypothetical protein
MRYLDENNGISNKLYAVCRISLRMLMLGMMIAAAERRCAVASRNMVLQ